MNGYEDPSPPTTKAHRQDRSMATTAHNHDRRTATRAHWHLIRQTATGAHDDQRMEMPIQTRMPAQMRRWTKHEPQPEHETPHRVHIHEASHDASTSVAISAGS